MERLEDQQGSVRVTTTELVDVRAKIADVEATRDASLATITDERTIAAAGRHTVESAVPEELLALYVKQRTRYGTGASLLRGGVSQASGVKLLEDELQLIRSAAPDDVLICPSSDAILVRTDESGL